MHLRARLAVPLVLAAACVRNPATGGHMLSLVSKDQEIQMGKEAAKEVLQSIPPVKDEKLQAYVAGIGKRIAAASERPDLPWSFTVIDDATVNAFALPGGPVFVTRGILTYLDTEAELAAVLGHEIGHITARHSVQQISKAQLAQLGLGLGMILRPDLQGAGQLASAGLQLVFLKFGRDDEAQADALGFRYMLGQGYDPRQMADVFAMLERASARNDQGKLPEWLSTHPDPENRVEVARKRVAELKELPASLEVGRDRYLAAVDGTVFGDDPRQGYFQGNAFLHPDLRFRLDLPPGWKAQNTPQALVAVSPKQDAALQLSVAGTLSPEDAARKFFGQQGVKATDVQKGSVHGLPATAGAFEAQTQQGVVQGLASFVSHRGATYMVVGYAPAGALAAHEEELRRAITSFAPLDDPKALDVKPARVEVVTVPGDMTLREFDARWPSTIPLDLLAVVNGVEEGGTLRAGQRAKRVVGGTPGSASH
jgi:predicted Zn-dependent protease